MWFMLIVLCLLIEYWCIASTYKGFYNFYKKKWYLKQKHLGCKKSARPIRSNIAIAHATKKLDMKLGQEGLNKLTVAK